MRSPVGCKYRHALRAKSFGSRVCFFRMAPSVDGERARQLANTLLGAKDGGHHHPKRTSALTSLKSDTMLRLSYDNIMVLRVNRPSTRHRNRSSGATSSRATQTRQHHCALLTMSSSIFGAEQRISEPLSALAVLTGRHRGKKHPRPNFSQKQRVNEFNESTI